jgi:hypothetical protein
MAMKVDEFSRVGSVVGISRGSVRISSHVSWYGKLKIVFGVAQGLVADDLISDLPADPAFLQGTAHSLKYASDDDEVDDMHKTIGIH